MTDPNTLLQRLRRSLNILEQRRAKYGIDAPASLVIELEDHETAIDLTEQLAKGYLTEAAWREQLLPLLVKIEERQATELVSSLTIGGVNFSNISHSTINIGNINAGIHAGGDVVSGDKVTQTAKGSNIAQASHGGHAEVNSSTIDQRGQQVSGDQYNVGGDIHIHKAAPARPVEPIPTRIPAPRTTTFVGRSDDLDWLCNRLKAGDVAAVAGVRGIGGIGKTELAIAAANRLEPHFGEAHILWLECGPNTVQAIQERLAAALGIPLPDNDLRLRADSLALALKQRPATLVVLDDIRHHHLADFRYLLPPRPPCALLVTSRRDDLPDIPWPAIKKLDVLAPAQAELLLTNLLADIGLAPEPEPVAEVCTLLEQIPLALTLAARRAGQLARRRSSGVSPLTTLLAELQQRRRVLVLKLGDRPDVSIIATFQMSCDELSEDDQARLNRLGVFARNDLELPAVQAVWAVTEEEARRTLLNLTNAGLLEEVDDQVWWMHDLLREYAGDRLAQTDADASDTAYLNHAEFWRDYLVNLTLRSLADWRDLETHRPEVESAAAWLAGTPTSPLYLQVQLPYAIARTFPGTTFPWLTTALGAALTAARQWQTTAADEDERNVRAAWLAVTQSSLADLLYTRGQYEEAERLYRESLAVFEEIGDRRSVAVTQSSLADLLYTRGQYEEAERLYRESLAVFEEIGDRR
ncbi:MAG: tetratricopeptide repeat protein [Anaerolineae bacterium]|nr:tetratricopeptide repeat protein [Anaerolineae bacterium]